MATFTTPLPAPVKNDWLPTGESARLSPPSPGGPRKNAPVQQVIFTLTTFYNKVLKFFLKISLRDRWEVQQEEDLHHHLPVEDQLQQFQTGQEVNL